MKKIRRKASHRDDLLPAFLIGYTASDPIPPGLLVAWFDQQYGGPLRTQLAHGPEASRFEAHHGPWAGLVDTGVPPAVAEAWKERIAWGHDRAAQVLPLRLTGADRRDLILHMARLARGLTLLTDGTAYDVATGAYLNPSDWSDRPLREFRLSDHLRIEAVSGREDARVWFHTRGMGKFGIEDIETYRAAGLSERPVLEALAEIAETLINLGKAPKVGEDFTVDAPGGIVRVIRVIRHRTDQSYGDTLILREVAWEESPKISA